MLRLDFDGIYLLGMTELLWKLTSMVEHSQDLSDELKEKIESLREKIENENIGLNEAANVYKKLEIAISNFRYQKAFEMQLNSIMDLKEVLKECFNVALNKCNENYEKRSRLCEIYRKMVLSIDLAQKRIIKPAVIMNLSKLTFDNEIVDNLVIQATILNKEFTSSPIYLKCDINDDEECDFTVLVQENDKYFMVSYNSDGSIKFKEEVSLVSVRQAYIDGKPEIVESVIKANDNRNYTSIDEIVNEKNKWKYNFSLKWITVRVVNEKTETEHLVIGYYNGHEICLQDGILNIRVSRRLPDEKRTALNYGDSYRIDNNTLIKILEAQLSSLLSQDETKKLILG